MEIDIRDREYFVKEVAESIRTGHASTSDSSFIFGISGKWGEGKTTFLDHLEVELKEFTVIKINPWKFAADKTSFLRYFLKRLHEVLPEDDPFPPVNLEKFIKNKEYRRKCISKISQLLRYKLTRRRDFLVADRFRNLDFDASFTTVNSGPFLLTLLILILVAIIYLNLDIFLSLLPSFLQNWIVAKENKLKVFASSLGIIGLVTAFFGKILTTQSSSRALSTLDQFDSLLKDVLEKFRNKKIAIFVDDLDRVTPQMARDVLDNLRTFFDRGELSFIVTGDHTVLERYIGNQISENGDDSEKLEEGRRYLKKIFNVYWRLPLPIKSDFEVSLELITCKHSDRLTSIFKDQSKIKTFKYYLSKFFESNYREVQRFVETVLFTFRIIDRRYKSADRSQKPYFKSLIDYPLLVVRVLMIQEFCTPFFDAILRDGNILFTLENAIEKSDEGGITSVIESADYKLSPSQKKFLRGFLSETPRFYEKGILVVPAIEPFLLLAADASLGDSRGPTPEDFMEVFKTNDTTQISDVLVRSGEDKIKKAVVAAFDFITKQPDAAQKNNSLKLFVSSLINISAPHIVHSIFRNSLKDFDLSYLPQVGLPERIQTVNLFFQWFNSTDFADSKDYLDKFPFQDVNDLSHVDELSRGKFGDLVVSLWLVSYYSQDKVLSLDKILEIAPKLDIDRVKEELTTIKDSVAAEIISDLNSALREKRLEVLTKYIHGGNKVLKEKVLSEVAARNNDIWAWSVSQIPKNIWSQDELESQIVSALDKAQSIDEFVEVFDFSNGKLSSKLNDLWAVVRKKKNLFADSFSRIAGNSYTGSPNDLTAKILFREVLKKVKTLSNDQEKISILGFLKKDVWIWANLEPAFAKKEIVSFMRLESDAVKDVCNGVLQNY